MLTLKTQVHVALTGMKTVQSVLVKMQVISTFVPPPGGVEKTKVSTMHAAQLSMLFSYVVIRPKDVSVDGSPRHLQ